jgi:hypothetical protein
MTTARIATFSAQHHDALRQIGQALRALRTRLIEARRQRYHERRMLLVVQQLDHPGVLADVQTARTASR